MLVARLPDGLSPVSPASGCPSARAPKPRTATGEDPLDHGRASVEWAAPRHAPDADFDRLLTSLLTDHCDEAGAKNSGHLHPALPTGSAAALGWDSCHASPFHWPAGGRVPSGSGETPYPGDGCSAAAIPPLAGSRHKPALHAPASANLTQPAASSKQQPRRSSSSSPFPQQQQQPAADDCQAPHRLSASPPHQQAAWRPWKHDEDSGPEPSEAAAVGHHSASCLAPDGFGAAVAHAGHPARAPITTLPPHASSQPSQPQPRAGWWSSSAVKLEAEEGFMPCTVALPPPVLSPRAGGSCPSGLSSDRGCSAESSRPAILASMSSVLPASLGSSHPGCHSPNGGSMAEPSVPADLAPAAPGELAQARAAPGEQGRTADTAGSAADGTGQAASPLAAGGADRSSAAPVTAPGAPGVAAACGGGPSYSPPRSTQGSTWQPQPSAVPPCGRMQGLLPSPPLVRPQPPPAAMPPYGVPHWGPRGAAAHGHPPYPAAYYPHYPPYPHYRHLQPPQPPHAAFASHGYLPYGMVPLRRPATWHHHAPAPPAASAGQVAEDAPAPVLATAAEAGSKRPGGWRGAPPPPVALWPPEHAVGGGGVLGSPCWEYGGDPWLYGASYDSAPPYGLPYMPAYPPPGGACLSPRRRPRAHSIDGVQPRVAAPHPEQAASAAGFYGNGQHAPPQYVDTGARLAEETDSAKRRRLAGTTSLPLLPPAGSTAAPQEHLLDAPLTAPAPSAAAEPSAPSPRKQQPQQQQQQQQQPATSAGAAAHCRYAQLPVHLPGPARAPAFAPAFAPAPQQQPTAAHSAFAAVQGGLLPEAMQHAIMDSFDLEAFAAQLDLHDFDLTAPASDFEGLGLELECIELATRRISLPCDPPVAAPASAQAVYNAATVAGAKVEAACGGEGCGPVGATQLPPSGAGTDASKEADAAWHFSGQPLTVAAPPPAAAAAAQRASRGGAAPSPPSPPGARKTPTRRAHGNISRLQRPLVQPASALQLPGPIRVTVTTAGGLSAARGGAASRGRDDSDSDGEAGGFGGSTCGFSSGGEAGAGSVMGLFHAAAYIEGDKCIEYGGAMVSRSAFERAGGSIMAKWYRSIKVLPEGLSLGKWLQRNGLPILKGNPRCSRKVRARASPRGGAAAKAGAGYGDDDE
ncbi:hypothetical protein TSOC_004683 [Tetrabaena socialis]|uniref:Uncharacterized protein n=1 Tax=Tetrabaena socialis TaxID=47790 RepID=A0A2J8A8B5_9CHLO|nr:hypothetical protein TSOC_004683 [Tetrabaena socialis]|eukprot:PNH08740.1 hypothetical protein TSOC_004683 [Tetrabaena socialis]